jgi:hypothetical protein
MKFTAEASKFPKTFVGFWKMQEGEIVRGILLDAFDSENDQPGFKSSKCFIIELGKNEFGPHVDVTVETRDRDTHDKIDRTAKAGTAIGVNEKAGLRGLHKLVGHAVNIKCLGKKATDGGGSTYEFDVDFGAKVPAKKDEKKAPQASTKSA